MHASDIKGFESSTLHLDQTSPARRMTYVQGGRQNSNRVPRSGFAHLGWALFNEQYSLKSMCEAFHTKNQKLDHEPTGTVTSEELEYCRQDVRCTLAALNSLKEEFDRHPLNKHRVELYPDKAVSPASTGKAYLPQRVLNR